MGTIKDLLNFPEMEQLRKDMEEEKTRYEKEVSDFWDKLSYDEQLMAFYQVTSKIYKSDVIDCGSYRYCIYEIFGFEPDAYMLGMESHYMDLHNTIAYGVDFQKCQQAEKITLNGYSITIPQDKKFEFWYDVNTKEMVIKTVDLENWEI